jgi:hypothetical protein
VSLSLSLIEGGVVLVNFVKRSDEEQILGGPFINLDHTGIALATTTTGGTLREFVHSALFYPYLEHTSNCLWIRIEMLSDVDQRGSLMVLEVIS